MSYDCHTHSYFSDGELSPQQLINHAIDSGVTHLALTDHDTTYGLADAHSATQNLPIELINGVELSCHWNFQLLHIIGLNIDPENAQLQAGIRRNRDSRFTRAEAMHEDFLKRGIDLRDAVAAQIHHAAVPTRPHFAQALIELGYAKNKHSAFKHYLVPGKPGFVAMYWPPVAQIAQWINAAGGVAVLAHPMRYKLSRTKLIELIKHLKSVGVEGIEVNTPITQTKQSAMLADLARDYDLLASIGSDFHSHDQVWAKLGSATALPNDLTPVWSRF